MIGLNAGLIGSARTSRRGAAVGLWTPNEQVIYQRQNAWIGDVNFDNVSLLLHMDGSNGSTTFTDSSSNALAVTRFGDAQISTAQSKFGGASAIFDGTGDYLQIANTPKLSLDAQNFTIEGWFYFSAFTSLRILVDARGTVNDLAAGYFMYVTAGGNIVFQADTTAAGVSTGGGWELSITGATALSTGQWYHLAVTRNSSSFVLFVNGNADGSATSSITIGSLGSYPVSVGAGMIGASTYGYFFNGYIDDIRITKGTARYTGAFTVPSAPFPNA